MAGGEVSLPTYANVGVTAGTVVNNTQPWYTAEPSALWQPASRTRLAAQWYWSSPNTIDFDVHLTDGLAHRVSLYLLDLNGTGSETVDVLDGVTGAVLDSESASDFVGGKYLSWALSGDVMLRVDGTQRPAVASGLFFGAGMANVPHSGTASLAGSDTTTQGNWHPTYGSEGYDMAGGEVSLPAYASVGVTGGIVNNSQSWYTADPSALWQPTSSTRLAAQWYSSSPNTLYFDVHLTDGLAHRVSLYLLDLNGTGGETVDVLDGATGAVLDAESVSGFVGGEYLSWDLSGDVMLRVDGTQRPAVASGLFFDPTPPPATPSLADPGFEDISVNAATYVVDPANSRWYFQGTSGISSNNSAITSGNPPAPEGKQVAFLQNDGEFAQTIVDWRTGTYRITFNAAQRVNNQASQQVIEVEFDQKIIGIFTPSGNSYQSFTTSSFEPVLRSDSSNWHVITFIGLNIMGGDNVALIDNVGVTDVTGFTSGITGAAGIPNINFVGYVPQAQDQASEIAAGPDGSLWRMDGQGSHLGHYDPSSNTLTTYTVPPNGVINGWSGYVMAGPDGGIWYSGYYSMIGRFDPVTGLFSRYPLPYGGRVASFAAGSDGNLWFTDYSLNKIGKMDINTHQVYEYSVPTSNSQPYGITTGPDGALWFTEYRGQKIGRLDPLTQSITEFAVPTFCNSPARIMLGPDGNLWFNGYFRGIGQFNLKNSQFTAYHIFDGASGIAAGPDGNIWFTSAAGSSVGRIDLSTGAITEYEVENGTAHFGDIVLGTNGNLYTARDGYGIIGRVSLVETEGYSDVYYVSADDSTVSLGASISLGTGTNGNLIGVGDGSVVQWRVEGTGGTLDQIRTTTVDGTASNTLHTTTRAGDTFRVFAKIISLFANGRTYSYNGPEILVPTITVTPGKAANISFSKSVDTLISDGKSNTKITLMARDAEGNLVVDGSQIDWDLSGLGKIVTSDSTTLNGKATLVLQAGVMPEDQTVSATIDGYKASTTVTSDKVNISLGITGNVVTLGSSDTALVTATVTDAEGNPVPDGTPITWFTQKGTILGNATVVGGVATASLYATGGSQVPGSGVIKAFVGSNVGSANYLFVNASNQVNVKADNPLLAGDATTDGSFSVAQVDGSSIPYDYKAGTTCTITNGDPGAVVIVTVGNGSTPGGLLTVAGDNGIPGTTASVTLDAQGRGTYRLQSTGALPAGKAIVMPIGLAYDSGWWFTWFTGPPPQIASFNVALQPAEQIGRTLDYIGKLGWSILAGPGDSADAIAADMAFSFIPVVGGYSDIRDAGSELLKLWPGGESPDWVSFGFAIGGIIAEVTPADVAVDFAKGLYKAAKVGIINPGGIILRTSFQKLKDLGSQLATGGNEILQKIDELCDSLSKFLPPPFGNSTVLIGPEGIPFGRFVDDALQNPDELRATQTWMSRIDDHPQEVAGFAAQYGQDAAKNIVQTLGQLSDDLIDALVNAGKLDIVAEGIGKAGWIAVDAEKYAKMVIELGGDTKIVKLFDEFADVPGSNRLIYKLDVQDLGLQRELTVAKLVGKENIERLSLQLDKAKYGQGEIDGITGTIAYEVKSNLNAKSGSYVKGQLERLVRWSLDNAKSPVCYIPNSVGELKGTIYTAINSLSKKYGVTVQIIRFDDV